MKKLLWLSIVLVTTCLSTFGQAVTVNGLVALVRYKDNKISATKPQIEALFNQESGFNLWGNATSAKQFYKDQSNSNFILNSTVVEVDLPENSAHYHAPNLPYDGGQLLVSHVVAAINAKFPSGFTNLTLHPTDNRLWHFCIISQSGPTEGAAVAYGTGPHFIKNNGQQMPIRNVALISYTQSNNYGVNVICHELGHSVMSWTDFYRTAFCNTGDYDVMGSAGTSKGPMPVNPGLRLQRKWINDVVDIFTSFTANTYTLKSNSYSQIHRYKNPNNPKEYLLFYALKHGGHYQATLDGGKPLDEGLSIWYVDEDCKFDKPGVDDQIFIRLVQADNLDEMHDEFIPNSSDVRGDLNDFYDHISNKFPNNHPFRWKDGGEFGISISNISAPGATMSFTVDAMPNTIIVSSDNNGTVSPKGTFTLPTGQSKVFTLIPNLGYELSGVIKNGVPLPVTNNTFTLSSIDGVANIDATFKKKATIPPLTSPWQKMDIGTVNTPLLAAQESSKFHMESYGTHIGGTSDSFGYVFQTLNGDGNIVVKMASSNMASWNQRTGIMLRESLEPNSAFTMIGQIPHSGMVSQSRTATGTNSINNPTNVGSLHTFSLHNWFKIARFGNEITQSCSRDGLNWTVISKETMTLGKSVYVGMVTTGALATNPSKATFENVNVFVLGNVAPVVNITAPLNDSTISDPTAINITATASDSDGSIARVDFYNGVQLLGTDNTAPYSFVWTNVGGGKYNILAKAIDNQGAVTTSIPAKVKVPCVFNTPKLTGAVVGTSGSWNNGGNTREKAFDGNTTTYFDAPSDVAWTGLSLDKSYNITGINFFPRKEFTGRMLGGKFQGSNTADFSSGVEDLATITIEPALEWNCITINNNASYKYVRYICAAGGVGNVAEIEFYGKESVAPSGLTVWFKKPANTQAPRIHYWNVVPAQAASSWPGVAMTQDLSKGADWYKFTITNATSTNLLFHDNAGYKTADLTNVKGGCFDGNTKTWVDCTQNNAPTVSVWFKKPTNTQAPLIHYWNVSPAQPGSAWPGVLMTQDLSKGADWYKFTMPNAVSACVLFHDGAVYKTVDQCNVVTGCYDGNTKTWINCNQENVLVQSVSVNPTSASIGAGATQTITATILPSNASNKNITWASSNTAVATVNASGVVTAISAGNATITATTVDGSFTATIAITVTAQKTITIYVVKREGGQTVPKIHVWKNETGTDVAITNSSNWPNNLPNMIRADGSSTQWYKYTVTANRIGTLFRYGTTQSPDVKYYTEDVFVVLNSDGTIRKTGASLEEVANDVHNKTAVEVVEATEKVFIVSPNPASEIVNIKFQGTSSSKVDLVIYDMLGNFVYSQTENVSDGILFKTIDTFNFRSGVYIVSINDGTQVLNQKLIIK